MDLVDKQYVARLQVGEDRRQVAGPLDHRPRGLAQVDAQLGSDDHCERGLAQARRSEDQRVIERLAAPARRLYKDCELAFDLFLTDIVLQRTRADRPFELIVLAAAGRIDDPLLLDHGSVHGVTHAPHSAGHAGSNPRCCRLTRRSSAGAPPQRAYSPMRPVRCRPRPRHPPVPAQVRRPGAIRRS